MRLLIGTYTRGTDAEGIYAADFDPETGAVGSASLYVAADNPSFLVRQGEHLFACSEIRDGDDGGELLLFTMAPDKVLLHQVVSSHGADPCHAAVGESRVAVANYTGGTFGLYEFVNGRIGALLANPSHTQTGPHPRQTEPHPHGVYFIGDELWVTDLGGDHIARYRSADGGFVANIRNPTGSGPRHLTAQGRYCVNELANTVDEIVDGEVVRSVSTLPQGWDSESSTAEIVHAGGHLYVSNRGHNSIAVFATEPVLTLRQHKSTAGRHPRHFLVDPSNRWLIVANLDTSNVVTIEIDKDGLLGEVVSEVSVPSPACLLLV